MIKEISGLFPEKNGIDLLFSWIFVNRKFTEQKTPIHQMKAV